MKVKKLMYLVILCFAAWSVAMLQWHLLNEERYKIMVDKDDYEPVETEEFRKLYVGMDWLEEIKVFAEVNSLDAVEVLTYYMLENDFVLQEGKIKLYDVDSYMQKVAKLKESKSEDFESVCKAYAAVFGDIKYFPIPESSTKYPIDINFSDGWGSERYYEDEMHLHEGTDIITNHRRGYVPIVSMTAGVVENVGWLKLGGYRIGIRSENGGYFYYAHLYKYSKKFNVGDTVKAGELIGFMGDSGYGNAEGTVGKFDVHLHLGIYIKTANYEELSVNPYAVLLYLKEKRVLYNMQGEQ